MQPMDLTAYRDLWKTHGVMALLASALVARMPVMATMVPLAFLAKDAAGNFGWAGVVAGAYSVGTAVASVVWSRLADRRGARKVVIGTGMAWGASMAVVALLPYSWFRVLPVAAAVAGVFVAPVTSALRANWPRIVHGSRLRAIYSLDATAQELLFVIGPMTRRPDGQLRQSSGRAAGMCSHRGRGDLVVRSEAAAAGPARRERPGPGRPYGSCCCTSTAHRCCSPGSAW